MPAEATPQLLRHKRTTIARMRSRKPFRLRRDCRSKPIRVPNASFVAGAVSIERETQVATWWSRERKARGIRRGADWRRFGVECFMVPPVLSHEVGGNVCYPT